MLARPKVHARHRHHRPKVLQLLFGLGLERSQRLLLLRGLLFRRRLRLALLALRVLPYLKIVMGNQVIIS